MGTPHIKNRKGARTDGERLMDLAIGMRLSMLRKRHGMTQADLAARSGITHQQIQKYEKGTDRIAASRLFKFSRILDVSPLYFFDGFH